MKKMKLLVLFVFVVFLLAGCGEESDEIDRLSTNENKTTTTGTPNNAAKSGAAKPNATATPTSTPTPVPKPKTAEAPAALHRKDVVHASGVTEEWTDPDTGKKCTVVEDLGEDGCTKTMNCFDTDGNLVWWEYFQYDENDMISMICRMLPEGGHPIHSVLFLQDKNGVLVKTSHIDPMPEDEGDGDYTSYVEEYYPNGTVKSQKTYYPNKNVRDAIAEYVVQYDENGNETYRSHSDRQGHLLEEYVNGVKNHIAPDTVYDMLKALNNASEEDFEGLWEACQKKITEKRMSDKWDELCEAYSCIIDGYYQSELSRLREEYGLILFDYASDFHEGSSVDVETLAQYLETNPASVTIAERIYRPDSHLALDGTLWLPDEYKAVKGKKKLTERNDDDPILVLVVDYSKTIWNETIKRSMLLEDPDTAERMVDRAEEMIYGLFIDYSDIVSLTSYPELADVILEIRAEYPYAGKYYYSDGTPAKVWNTSITLKAINQRGKGETSATFKNNAGDTVSVYGGTEIYMEEPDLRDDEYSGKAEKFAKTVLSWFGK